MAVPARTRYAKSGGVSIAYQVVGDGPIDLVFTQGFVSNVDHWWEMPNAVRLLERLASFSRLILWDKRGTGLSDPSDRVPTSDERVDDLRAVMESVGSERAALYGISEGGPMSVLFAATYPERTSALVLYGTSPKFTVAPEWSWGFEPGEIKGFLEEIDQSWGEGALAELFAPTYAGNELFRQSWGRFLRSGASPAMGRAVFQALCELDCRDILPAVRVPTLILHRTGDRVAKIEAARYMAEQIPGAKLVELPGDDHPYTVGDQDAIVDEIEEFLTGIRHVAQTDRALLTVLFTDIVGSTQRAAELGDRRWRDLLEAHGAAVRREIARFEGREVKTTGDGFLVTFTSPSRAIRCASTIRERLRPLGIEIRGGLHTGECELIGEDVGGLAVHIAARVATLAGPNEVLVSSTVRDLVVGSDVEFTQRGTYELRGVPGEWRLFTVEA
jgi:class 3 adenylate cyclase